MSNNLLLLCSYFPLSVSLLSSTGTWAWSSSFHKRQRSWKVVPESVLYPNVPTTAEEMTAATELARRNENVFFSMLGDNDKEIQNFHDENDAPIFYPTPNEYGQSNVNIFSQRDETVHDDGKRPLSDAAPIWENARVSYTDAGTLLVNMPAPGYSMNSALAAGFSVAWFSALIPATTLAAAPILLPFYLAGGLVAKDAFVKPFTSTLLSIGIYAWSLEVTRYGRTTSTVVASGASSELHQARVVELSSVDDKTRRVTYRYTLELLSTRHGGKKPLTVAGPFDNPEEPAQLAQVINAQLAKIRTEVSNDSNNARDEYRFALDKAEEL